MRERSVALKIPQPNMHNFFSAISTVHAENIKRSKKEDDMLSSQSDRKNSGVRESQS